MKALKKNTALNKAKLIARLASEKKGDDIVVMDMRRVSTVAERFVLVTVASSRRLNAIIQAIMDGMKKNGSRLLRVEGKNNLRWGLLDYEDVVVHVFCGEFREFYGLERLWSDAPKKLFDSKCLRKKYQNKSKI